MTTPQLLAHRGFAGRYPENTRTALRAAVDAGARFIEFDIQISRDQVPFLLHDGDFLRTGGEEKSIFDLDADEAERIPVCEAARLGNVFSDVYAPRLEQIVADLQAWPDVTAFVEIKKESVHRFGVAAVLDAVLPVIEPVADQCVVIAFEQPVIEEARRRTHRPVGWALRKWDEEHRRYAEGFSPAWLFCNIDKLPPEPEALWAGSWQWVIYEIVDPDVARGLHARGVQMVETMAFADMYAALSDDSS